MTQVVEIAVEQIVDVAKDDSVEDKSGEATNKEVTSAAEVPSDDFEKKIIHQVEYYFGDANLMRDKYLLEQIGKDEDGWVPISVLLTFKRLASFTTDPNVVVNALMKSDNGVVEISDDKSKIRRHPEKPIPEYNEETRKEIMSRTAYVKGFPLDSDLNVLLKYFGDFDKVTKVYMRKYFDKATKTYKFKGSCFVTFETKEEAKKLIEDTQEF